MSREGALGKLQILGGFKKNLSENVFFFGSQEEYYLDDNKENSKDQLRG